MKLEIRKFEDKDLDELSSLISRVLREINIETYSKEIIEALVETNTPNKLSKFARKEDNLVLVCLTDREQIYDKDNFSKIVGTVSLVKNRVRKLYVDPDYQRRGIGTKLVREIEQKAVERGYSYVFLTADPDVVGFYQKLGYKKQEEERESIDNLSFEVVRMEKSFE